MFWFLLLQHMNAHQAYEVQISSMTKTVSKLEEQLRHELDEKALILSDLASVRELCVKLDSSKEQFSRQLTARNMEYERVSILAQYYFKPAECLQLAYNMQQDIFSYWNAFSARKKMYFALLSSI